MQSTSLLVRLTTIVGVVGFVMLIALPASPLAQAAESPAPRAMVGAYYFDGWAGRHRLADTEAWAKDAPTHLTKRMLDEFPDREPIWGWRDDRLEVMEQQIDLAADHGIAFFAFCWYWHPTQEQIDEDPKHTGLKLFLKARNSDRMKFCLLVANHEGFLIGNTENWKKAAEGWMPYLTDKRHVTVDGKPLVLMFNPADGHSEGLGALQAEAKKAGLPGVAIAACGRGDPKLGYTHRTHYNITLGYTGGSQEHRYAELVAAHPGMVRLRGQAQTSGSRCSRLGQAAVGRTLRAEPEAGMVFPRSYAGRFWAVPEVCHRLDGRAPGADNEGAAGPRVRLERVR